MTAETDIAAPLVAGEGSVLVPGDVRWALAGAEVVVHAPALGSTHVLDAVASLVWQCLDGESALREVFCDLGDAFGVAPAQVAADCLPVVESWLNAGIVVAASSAVLAERRAAAPLAVAPLAAAPESTAPPGRTWRRLVDPPSS